MKQVLVGGLSGSVTGLGVMLAVALYVVETIVRPTKRRDIFDEYSYSPFEFDLPAENVAFPPMQGNYLVSGWFVPHPQATTTILVCPGYRTRKSDVLGISAQLWKAGHNLLIFDYYGHGTDIGTPVTLGYREINDFLGAVAYARERAPHTRLGVMAYSMGASIAIMACARSNDVEVLVLDSAFATHWSVVNYLFRRALPLPSVPFLWLADQLIWWRARYRFHQVEPLRDIAKLSSRPILLIHGGKDSMVDPRDATLLYKAAGEPKELWFLPEADHCGAYFADRAAYTEKISAFFELYLKKPRLQLIENKPEEQVESGDAGVSNANQDLSEAS
jgi:fermentation-respiration switch protein FrsA (DUF1100 family)